MNNLTAHMIVKNEEYWVWYAITSVINFVDKILIYDTGSKDKTVNIIKMLSNINKKIIFEQKEKADTKKMVALRNEQIEKTKTEWFLLVDGDEVWPKKSLASLVKMIKQADKSKVGIVTRTYNCIGDIYHYLPEKKGKYHLLGMKGHFNIRAYRKIPGYQWQGNYPLESYVDKNGLSINEQNNKLLFLDKYYWHLTHLPRSSKDDHRSRKYGLGVKFSNGHQHPEVFSLPRPKIVKNPWVKMDIKSKLLGETADFLRRFL